MALALARPADCAILREHPVITFRNGPYLYTIQSKGGASTYTVTDGRRAISVPVLWAFGYGIGGVGQTYVFRYGGYYFESQVSFYAGINNLAITMGHILYAPDSLGQALGYPVSNADIRKCFACHATGALTATGLQLNRMIPGVSCELCHGPGAEHIAAVRARRLSDLHIFNPASLSAGQMTQFCGACHRTDLEEKRLGIHGVENVRFQGYRLARSRCYNPRDNRIRCTACHDPHEDVATVASYYDTKCLACHALRGAPATSKQRALACPVASKNCVTCHMPKVDVPGVYHKFTDHFIRVVKPNEPYPS